MKKIYAILTLMLCITFVGCSDNDDEWGAKLKVISSDVSFDCLGGTGNIIVESALPITASSSEEWCQVQVEQHKVIFNIDVNLLIGSRTAVITVQSGGEESKVAIYQLGDIFDTTLKDTDFTDKGGTVTFMVKSNWDIEFEDIDESWIACTYSKEEETVTITASPLTESGVFRSNTIKVKAGTHEISPTFTQVNMAGKYNCYTNGGGKAFGTCTIENGDKDFEYIITPKGSPHDGSYKAKVRNGELVIAFGQYLGLYDYQFPHAYLCAYDKAGYLTWSTSTEYVAPLNGKGVNGEMILVFGDNGTWSGQKVGGFYYALFDKTLEEGGAYKAGFASATDLVWQKVID